MQLIKSATKSTSSVTYKAVVHPLSEKLTRFLTIRVPACIEVPQNTFVILEGLFFEQGKACQVGKKIQLVYNLNMSSTITNEYLDEFAFNEHQ